MKSRLLAALLALLALMTAGAHFSGAAFTGTTANPSNNFTTAMVFPGVTLTDPGANLRGTIGLNVTTTGTIASVTYQRAPAGGSTWTDICTSSSSPYSCNFDTTVPNDGLYDLRASAYTGTTTIYSSVITNRRVDNTAPSVTMTDPGAFLRSTIDLQASATDTGGSGVFSITIQRRPSSGGTWTDVCTQNPSSASCSTNTATWGGDGLYDVRAVALDVAGNPSSYSTVTSRRVDNTAPTTASITAPAANAYIRNGQALTGSGTDAVGVYSITYYYCSGATCTPSILIGASTTGPSFSVSWSSQPADGAYRIMARVADQAGNTRDSAIRAVNVDNTAPTALDVQTTNAGTLGQPEANDAITFSYSETMLKTSILSSWTAATATVTVRFIDNAAGDQLEVWNQANTVQLALTPAGTALNLAGNYVTANNSVAATMSQNGADIVITLNAAPANARKDNGSADMVWTPSAAATDTAGNACATGAVTESGATDRNF